MEYLVTAGSYIVCVIAGLLPPALWMLGRRKYQSPIFPVTLLHLAMLLWFFLARSDRHNAKGYGELVGLVLFTPYLLLYSLGLMVISLISLHRKTSLYAAIVATSLATALFAYEANKEFDWRLPKKSSIGRSYVQETPTKSATITGGATLIIGLFLASKRREKNRPQSTRNG